MTKKFEAILQRLINNLHPYYRKRARKDIDALVRRKGTSFEQLLRIVTEEKEKLEVRRTACWALGLIGNKRAVNSLLEVLRGETDKGLIWEAAKALALLATKRSVRPLITILLHSKDPTKREAAAYALGPLGDKRAVQSLLKTLNNQNEKASVRGQAAESLGLIGDKRATLPLIKALDSTSVDVRFWSAYALGPLGDRRALPRLKEVAAKDKAVLRGWWSVKKEATDAIKQIEGSVPTGISRVRRVGQPER